MDMTVLVSLVTGGAFLAFLQFLITRHDQKADKQNVITTALDAIDKRLTAIEDRIEKEHADNARVRILQISDECRRGILHSKETLDQVLGDISDYKRYCKKNTDYENSKAVLAIKNIESVYAKCLEEDDFL